MPTKHVAARIKATAADDTSLAEGQFVALASVFNNVDAYGDVVMPGAFEQDLTDWKASGETMPVYWGHRMDDPNMCIGAVLEAAETADGLQVKVQLDLDSPTGKQVYRLLKGRRVNRMSFAYDVVDGGWGERDGDGVYELRKLKVHEVSVVQVPANPAATVQDVKTRRPSRRKGTLARLKADTGTDTQLAVLLGQADQSVDDAFAAITAADQALDDILDYLGLPDADADEAAEDAQKRRPAARKAGRTLSAKNEAALRAALTKFSDGVKDINTVLESIDSSDDGKANPSQPAPPEEPDGAKGDPPAGPGPASVRLLNELGMAWAEFDQLATLEEVH